MAPVSTSSLSVVTVAQIGVEKGASEFLDMIQVGAPAQAITLTQKGLRYYVHGEVLEDRDFQTLQNNNWFNDKVINAFLKKIMEDENRKSMEHVFVIPSYLAVLWENDQYGTWMYKKVKLSLYKWIFMPVNVNRNHWVLLVADVYKRTVSILDSLPTPGSSTLIEKWKKYMKLRASVAGELPDWEEGDLVSSKQCDGSSCGPFVLMNALAIVNNIPIQELNTDMATYMRQYVSSSLLQAAKQPPSQRSTCDMLGCCRPTSEKCWICCDVCGRWMHFSCININQSPEGDYVCPICIAQYE
ncbi:ubiquitin-like-specific protease 1 [Haliotis rufescens]|uniref:ubiquitin-like-specific protease 1 n=1 Tax=Haliotis rufescens TaxID=6454 RepID=UPI00201ED535|nr:ubiquitin-like-specific protease 1 [Haliotis rufescens]